MPGEGARRHSVGAGEPSAVSEQGGDQSTVVGMEPGAASKPGQTDSGWGTPRDVEGLNCGGRRKGSEGAQCTETGASGPGEGLGSRSNRTRLMTQRRGSGPPPAKRARVVLGLTFEQNRPISICEAFPDDGHRQSPPTPCPRPASHSCTSCSDPGAETPRHPAGGRRQPPFAGLSQGEQLSLLPKPHSHWPPFWLDFLTSRGNPKRPWSRDPRMGYQHSLTPELSSSSKHFPNPSSGPCCEGESLYPAWGV